MFGHDSKSDIVKSLRYWDETHTLEEFYQLLLWDVGDFTDHGALSSYMQKADSEETFNMPSTCLKQMYHLRTFVQYISSLAPEDRIGP